MLKKLRCLAIIFFTLIMLSSVAGAAVITKSSPEEDDSVLIAGNPDFYPVEYYNTRTQSFEGIIPEILEEISSETGVNFTYIYKKNIEQNKIAQEYNCDIISASVNQRTPGFVQLFSYSVNGTTVDVGFVLTPSADTELQKVIQDEASKITSKQMLGYLIGSPVRNHDNSMYNVVIILLALIIITGLVMFILYSKKKSKKVLNQNKLTDLETGIGNLPFFESCFNSIISDDSYSSYYIAYIIIDSNFLQLYHRESTFSDSVKFSADVLSSFTQSGEFVARITDNGFALTLKCRNDEEAQKRLDELCRKLSAYLENDERKSEPFFRIAAYNLKQSDKSCELVLFNLRKNCNRLIGKDKYTVLCDEHMMNRALEEKRFLERIAKGFADKEFKLYLQFVVDSKTGKTVSAEALSRWHTPEKGVIPPVSYIEVMESSGIITQLDYYMFEKTCIQLHKWKDTKYEELSLSCNFTRITISEPGFVDTIKEISGKYVFARSKLILEITEDAIEKNREIAIKNILECKKYGFRIALDDLGTGYTSLMNLCEYPIDIVKIDRNVLLNTNKPRGKALLSGIISLAHSLNLKTVCEGVETAEQNEFVISTGCDCIQGWFYSKPMPAEDAASYFEKSLAE